MSSFFLKKETRHQICRKKIHSTRLTSLLTPLWNMFWRCMFFFLCLQMLMNFSINSEKILSCVVAPRICSTNDMCCGYLSCSLSELMPHVLCYVYYLSCSLVCQCELLGRLPHRQTTIWHLSVIKSSEEGSNWRPGDRRHLLARQEEPPRRPGESMATRHQF